MKCLVKKLGVSINNDNLPIFNDNLKSQIKVSSVNSNIQIVGENLPVTSFALDDSIIEIVFNGINDETTGSLIVGLVNENAIRLYASKKYKANSQGEATYVIECFSGNGANSITNTITLEKGKDVLCKFKGKDISFNNTVYTQPTYNNGQTIKSLLVFGKTSRIGMFVIKSIKITSISTNKTILEAYPALNNGKACLYDVVNNMYYEGTGDFEVE